MKKTSSTDRVRRLRKRQAAAGMHALYVSLPRKLVAQVRHYAERHGLLTIAQAVEQLIAKGLKRD